MNGHACFSVGGIRGGRGLWWRGGRISERSKNPGATLRSTLHGLDLTELVHPVGVHRIVRILVDLAELDLAIFIPTGAVSICIVGIVEGGVRVVFPHVAQTIHEEEG